MPDDAGETREQGRSLIEHIMLVPEDGALRIEIRGELAAILALASAGQAKAAAGDTAALAVRVKLDAEFRNRLDLLLVGRL